MTPQPRPARISRRAGPLLLAATGLVLGLLLLAALELIAGMILPAPTEPQGAGPIAGDAVSQTLAWLDINPAPQIPDAQLLWRNKPGARKTQPINPRPYGTDESWTIENNSEGFRGPERSSRPAAGAYRILCIGDSITFGFNVDQPHPFPRQLLDVLHSRYPGRDIEVINAGVPGWSWLQGLRFLETRGMALEPDLVVIGHGTNDRFFHAKITDEERFDLLDGVVERSRQLLEHELQRFNLFRLAQSLRPRSGEGFSRQCRRQLSATGYCRRVSLEYIGAAVERIWQTTRDAGVDLLVLNTDFLETDAVTASRPAAERREVAFLDIVSELEQRRRATEDALAERLGLAAAMSPAPHHPPPQGTRRIVVRVLVADPAASYRVEALPTLHFAETIHAQAHDDGLDGDEKAGDRVFSAALEVPKECDVLEYRFSRDDVLEFEPLPIMPSTLGRRRLKTPASGYGPVDVFAQSQFMAEQTHPNRHGHEVIASLVADRLRSLPSFSRIEAAKADEANR